MGFPSATPFFPIIAMSIHYTCLAALFLLGTVLTSMPTAAADPAPSAPLKIGIIGLDTSHATAFTAAFNGEKPAAELAGLRVTAAYPKGSPDIESSTRRVPEYIEIVKKQGVEIVDSIDALVGKVDFVLLETNDGRPHFEQALPVMKAGKPVFIDKPIAGSLVETIMLFRAAEKLKCPMFTSSSLRYGKVPQSIRRGDFGAVMGCDAYSPCHLEKTHPDLYWYGIHGCELLYTVMGPGCERVTRSSSADFDTVVGTWSDGRMGTFRGIRKGASGYGGTAFTEKGIKPLGEFDGYQPLVVEIAKFFRSKQAPIAPAESIELYTFMAAADESKKRDGAPVLLRDVMAAAEKEAEARLAKLGL